MAGTQILALRVGGRGGGGISVLFGLNQSLVLSAAQASAFQSN